MSYSGWLLKIGNYTIDTKRFVRADTYSAYVNMQDLKPWTDANGYLHREPVELKSLRVDFETPPLTNRDFAELMAGIRKNYTLEKGRQCVITAYIPEYDDYRTQTGYLADYEPVMYGNYGGTILYDAVAFTFVGGVYNG